MLGYVLATAQSYNELENILLKETEDINIVFE
jgi:hypothetical protein